VTVHPLPSGTLSSVAGRVLEDMESLVERLGQSYREVPEYAAMDTTILTGEVLPTSRRILEAFFVPLTTGDDPDPTNLQELPQSGRRRQDMGVPLEPLLHVYRICGRVVWDEIVSVTEAGEEWVLAELGARWMDYIDRAASIAAAAYLSASHERLRTVDARRRALLEELLAATDPAELAAVSIRFSTVLAPAYTPVLMEGDHARSRIDLILASAPDGTIGGFRGHRTLVLVPGPRPDLTSLVRSAGRSLVTWSDAAPPGASLLHEVGRAELLMRAATASGATDGVFGPHDLLIDQLLVGNPGVAAALRARVLDALAGRDHDGLITSTLREYLKSGSVSAVAAAEMVHANTVLYRLNRVKALTGLDPRTPADATLLTLALRASGGAR
jgi:hypothetical protein